MVVVGFWFFWWWEREGRQRKKWSKLLGSVWRSVSKFFVTELNFNPERSSTSPETGRCLCVCADLCLQRRSQRAARRNFAYMEGKPSL